MNAVRQNHLHAFEYNRDAPSISIILSLRVRELFSKTECATETNTIAYTTTGLAITILQEVTHIFF